VKFEESNIDRYGIRVDNGVNEDPMFFGKVIYAGHRYIGRYQPAQNGTCYIAVGTEEISVPTVLEILQCYPTPNSELLQQNTPVFP